MERRFYTFSALAPSLFLIWLKLLPTLGGRGAAVGRLASVEDAHLALRKRDLDPVFAEAAPDVQTELRAQIAVSGLRIADPHAELEIDAAVGEALDDHHRRIRLLQHARMPVAGLHHEAHRQ